MKVYGAPPSPFARKVRIVAAELGISDKIDFIDIQATPLSTPGDPQRDLNPVRKIPTLQYDDGRLVYDSLVICLALLDERPSQMLLPDAGPARIDVLTREALSRSLSDVLLAAIYETRLRTPEMVWSDWIDAQWSKALAALDVMEAAPPPDGRFDLGDCAWAASLSHLDLRFGDRGWRDGRPRISAWYDAACERPSVSAVL